MARRERSQDVTTEELLAQWDSARWSVACREMQIRISRGAFEAAHRVLSHFCRDTQPDFATLDSHVASVLPVRIANILEEAGYTTLRSVDNELDATLLRIENFGEVSVNHCRKTIAAVRAGTVPEICPDDDYDELIDSEHSYHLRTFNNYRPSISQPTEQRVMAASDRIKEAMTILMADTGGAIEILDKDIAHHEAEIVRLKSMRKLLGGSEPKVRNSELTPRLAELEARAFEVVYLARGDTSVSDLAKRLGASVLAVGMAVARSKRLRKSGKLVVLQEVQDV
jgi:hypothetical protein